MADPIKVNVTEEYIMYVTTLLYSGSQAIFGIAILNRTMNTKDKMTKRKPTALFIFSNSPDEFKMVNSFFLGLHLQTIHPIKGE